LFRRFKKMGRGEKCGRGQHRYLWPARPQQQAEDQPPKQRLFDERHENSGENRFTEGMDGDAVASRIEPECEQYRGAAEQGNYRDESTSNEIAPWPWIWCELQIAQTMNVTHAQKWPKQHDRGDEQRAVKERFEFEFGQKWKPSVCRPEKRGRKQRAEKNRPDEIA
jgi:hypothetical protein